MMAQEKRWLIGSLIVLAVAVAATMTMHMRRMGDTAGGRDVENMEAVTSQLELAKALKDPATREQAVRGLREHPDPHVIELLSALSHKNEDPDVRAACLLALGEIGDERGVHAMTIGVRDPRPNVRSAAAKALGMAGGGVAHAALALAVDDVDVAVRTAVVEALAAIPPAPESLDALVRVLSEEAVVEVRRMAAAALGKHRDEKARSALLAALAPGTQPDARLRAEAMAALLGFDDGFRVQAAVYAMGDPEAAIRERAAEAVGALGPDGTASLTQALQSPFCAGVLTGSRGAEALAHATGLLAAWGGPATFDGLYRVLELTASKPAAYAAVAERAATALAALGPAVAERLAAKTLSAPVSLALKSAAALAFAKLGAPGVTAIRTYVGACRAMPSVEEARLWMETLARIGGAAASEAAAEVREKDPHRVLERIAQEAGTRPAAAVPPVEPPARIDLEYALELEGAIYTGNPPSAYAKRKNNMPWLDDAEAEPEVAAYVPAGRTRLRLDLARRAGRWERIVGHGVNRGMHFGRVETASDDGDALRFSIRMGIAEDPWIMGGYGEYEVTLKRNEGGGFEGAYTGKYHGLDISGRATASLKPARPPIAEGFRPVGPHEHPRILFRAYELPALRARLGTPFGRAAFRRMAAAADPVCMGMVYRLVDDPSYAAAAIPFVREEMAKRDFGFLSLGQVWGPRLTTIALAYDLCWDAWPEDFRREVETYLVRVSNLTSTDMGRFSICANWSEDSNYYSPIQGGGAMLSLAYWMDPGRPPPPPPGSEAIPIAPAERVPPGVSASPLRSRESPRDWLWSGPVFSPVAPGEWIDALGGAPFATNGMPLRVAGFDRGMRPMPDGQVASDGIYPWEELRAEQPEFSAVSFLLHTVVDNPRPGYYRVELPPQGDSCITVAGRELPDRAIVKLSAGPYPVFVAHSAGSNAMAAVRTVFSFVTDDDKEMQTLLDEQTESLQRLRVWNRVNTEDLERTGMDARKQQVFHQCRTAMYRNARKLMGDGGYQSEGEVYTHTADTPVRYHTAYKRMFGEMVSPHPDATHFPLRYMVAAILREPEGAPPSLFMQPFNGKSGIGSGVQFMTLGFPVIPEPYKPGVLWIWNKLNQVDPGRPETRANIVEKVGLDDLPWLFVNYPLDPVTGGTTIEPEHPETNFPKTYQAMGKGMYLFRNRWRDSDDIVFQIYARHETGGGWSQQNAAALRLYGFGREWARTTTGRGAERWLDSVVLLPDNLCSEGGVGRTLSWAASADGSGHVSVDLNAVYVQIVGRAKEAWERQRKLTARGLGVDESELSPMTEDPLLRGMRAVAVDYSGRCGAPALMVVVDRIEAGGRRQWLWHLPAEGDLRTEVLPDGYSFLASQNGASLKGTFVAPSDVKILAVPDVKAHLERPELARSKAEQTPGFVANAPPGAGYFAVLTLQRGVPPPEVRVVSGTGLDSLVAVGDARIRFDGTRAIIE